MKLVTIMYDQAIHTDVLDVLAKHEIKGYTYWQNAHGSGETGTKDGTPVWPGLNHVLLAAIPPELVEPLIASLHELKNSFPMTPGLRVLVSDVEVY